MTPEQWASQTYLLQGIYVMACFFAFAMGYRAGEKK